MSLTFTTTTKNNLLDTLPTTLTAALFTGSNFSTDEVSGAPYARKSVTYDPATGGVKTASTLPVFDLPTGVTITHVALYDGSTRVAEGALPASEPYPNGGKFTLTSASIQIVNPV